MLDHARIRRESIRWYVLLTLNNARPEGCYEEVVLVTIQGLYADATPQEIRRELDYLADRQLIEVRREPHGRWFSHICRHGVDVAEYTVDCDPGIARPQHYWGGA